LLGRLVKKPYLQRCTQNRHKYFHKVKLDHNENAGDKQHNLLVITVNVNLALKLSFGTKIKGFIFSL